MQTSNVKKHLILIILVYILCYGMFSLVTVPFWDDWVLIGHTTAGLWEMFSQLGRREQYFMVAPFAAMANPLAWAAASFICWGIVAVCVYFVLRGVGWAATNAFWAALLTAASPLNQSRFALAVLPYSVSVALFASALWLLVISVHRRSLWLRILAATLLFLSFTTNSLLTMSPLAIIVVFLALRQRDLQKGFWRTVLGTTAYAELFALPFLYRLAKSSLQPVYGLYATYNQFQIGPIAGLLEAVKALVRQVAGLTAIFPSTDFLFEASYIAAIFTGLLILCGRLMRIDIQTRGKSVATAWMDALVLLGMAVLAFFPYTIVGLRPSFVGLWESRHQTTLALIAGTLAFSLLNAILPPRFVPACCISLICIFMAMNVSVSRQLMADAAESSAIIYAPQVAAIPDNTLIAVHADDQAHRMLGRTFRFYEVSAMLNAHRPKHTIMAMLASEVLDPKTGRAALPGSDPLPAALANTCARWVHFPEYGFGDIEEPTQFAELWLTPKSSPPTYWQGVATTIGLLFNRQSTIDEAIAQLDVKTQMRPDVTINCTTPSSS